MAGVALYGDMEAALSHGRLVALTHRLETVKILPPAGQNEPRLYGAITAAGIARAEDHAPRRRRVFCMAVTSDVGLGRGRPSSWSSAVDQLCYGGGDKRRLMVLAAGNLRGDIHAAEYLDRNDLEEVESPAQAWNPLVVGACTDKITITHPDYGGWAPVAPAGDLSPASRTSAIWDRQWPIRPDVVFEGGNFAHDGVNPASAIDDLQLVTTHYRPNVRLFEAFGDTSGAAALGANLAGGVMAAQPTLWPETVRGLIVQSAEWTHAMRQRFDAAGSQAQKLAMLRRYGWGIPELGRALLSFERRHAHGRGRLAAVSQRRLTDQDPRYEPASPAVAPRGINGARRDGRRAADYPVVFHRAKSRRAGLDEAPSLRLTQSPVRDEALT
jgi:hypothetical protein